MFRCLYSTPGHKTKFPYRHLQELPDPILLKYLTSNYSMPINSTKHRAKADKPDDDEAKPLAVGNELIDFIFTLRVFMSIILFNSLDY